MTSEQVWAARAQRERTRAGPAAAEGFELVATDAMALRYWTRRLVWLGVAFNTVELPALSAQLTSPPCLLVVMACPKDPVLRDLRRLHSSTYLAVLCGEGMPNRAVRLLRDGADAIVRPVQSDALIREQLRLATRMSARLSGVESERLSISEAEGLRRAELGILEYLIARPGRWVSQREILSEVLRVDANNSTSTVRVHIHSLRKSLGALADRLECKRGIGYRLAVAVTDAAPGRPAGTGAVGRRGTLPGRSR
jgi:DNA-binding response OmpR family regulator